MLTTKRYFLRFLAAFLAFAALLSLSPLTLTASAAEPSALPELISNYIQGKSGSISIGYYNTVSGEEYMLNGDAYFLAASIYKLPLNMYYYDMEAAGEISPDTRVGGYPLSYCHQQSLQYSNNKISQAMRARLGTYKQYKTKLAKYGGIPEESLPSLYFSGNYFNAAFILNTLKILYAGQDGVYAQAVGYLKDAHPGQWFESKLRDSECTVAQKYGWLSSGSSAYVHDAAIFYADEPFLLVVFTKNMGYAERALGDIARICYDYTQANVGAWRETVLHFKDVYATDWYAGAVRHCAERGIMNGTSGTTFSPTDVLTRGMLVTMLGRFAGAPSSSLAGADYFSAYVEWAYENGIADGVDESDFAPNTFITREQVAVMLYRYLIMEGLDPTGGNPSVGQFRDAAAISDYAKEAADVLHAYEIFLGDGTGCFAPQSNLTRAEAAMLFMRLDQKVENLLNPAAEEADAAEADAPEGETADIPETEAGDTPETETADIPETEAGDTPETETADIPEAETSDTPEVETSDTPVESKEEQETAEASS